jgi:hypothetical protein
MVEKSFGNLVKLKYLRMKVANENYIRDNFISLWKLVCHSEEENRPRVLENGVLRGIFEPKCVEAIPLKYTEP